MLLVPILGAITVGFSCFALYLDRVEYRSRIADVDEELVRAERSQLRFLTPSAAASADPEVNRPVQLRVTATGEVAARNRVANPFDAQTLRELAADPEAVNRTVAAFRVRVSPGPDGLLTITALPLVPVEEATATFRAALGLGGVVIVALQAAIVLLVTNVLVAPVTRMGKTATLVANGELDTTVGPPAGSREIAQLAVDLERMLTTLRATLAERERSAAEAVRARDGMQRFLADASHELRTPLTALRGYSELYDKGMLGEPGALDRAMGRVGKESVRLERLVRDMLQLARGEEAMHHTERFDLAVVLADVVSDLRSAYPTRPIELVVDPAARRDRAVFGTPGQVHQAVLNLGANACQHTPHESAVELRISTLGPLYCVEVVDHGPGIHPDDVEQIFQPFFRGDRSRTRGEHGGGAGLGLALVRHIAELHGGTVSVTPTQGGGATFALTLSMADGGTNS